MRRSFAGLFVVCVLALITSIPCVVFLFHKKDNKPKSVIVTIYDDSWRKVRDWNVTGDVIFEKDTCFFETTDGDMVRFTVRKMTIEKPGEPIRRICFPDE